MNWKTLLLSLGVSLSLCADYQPIQDKAHIPILTPALSEQKTAKIRLSNGLEAVLVSNPTIQKSAVNLIVLAGSYQDPIEHQGLAHFLEHMLFLGTKEYPTEMEFARFLSEHSGQMNAYTTPDYTSYQYSLASSGLETSFKRFSSFFKDPLLSQSGVQRELNAIDQEFAKGFNNEGSMAYYVIKDLMKEDHPTHRFQAGNSQSLSNATPDDLRNWFNTHYSPDKMKLYVLSSLDLSTLTKLVEENFSSIPYRETTTLTVPEEMFPKEAFGKEVIVPIPKEIYSIDLFWQIPDGIVGIDSEPDEMLNYVLAHKGKESLFSQLKDQGLVEDITASSIQLAETTRIYELQLILTEKGFKERNAIIEKVYATLHLLQKNPFPKVLYDEIALLKKQAYQYQEFDDPFMWARKQGDWLAREPLDTYPERSLLMGEFDPEPFHKLVAALTPDRAVLLLLVPQSSYKAPLPLIEPRMKIAYDVKPLPEATLKTWETVDAAPESTLNQPNPWIASDITVKNFQSTRNEFPAFPAPEKLVDRPGAMIYYTKETLYNLPRTFFRLQIQSPLLQEGKPKQAALADLLVKALDVELSDLIYEAENADLSIQFEHTLGGIQLSIEGFTESLNKAFPHLINSLISADYSQEEFEKAKEILSKEYHNNLLDMPIKQSFDYFKSVFVEDYATIQQKKSALKSIDLQSFQDFALKLFKKTHLKGMIAGSLSRSEAEEIASQIEEKLQPSKGSWALPYYPKIRSFKQSKTPTKLTLNSKAQGNALLLVLETPNFSPQDRNCQQILSSAMWEAFFSELRTKQQTGYAIKSDSLDLYRHLYSFFALQSSTHSPEELLWRFEQFFEGYLRNLNIKEITSERFETLKQAQIDLLKQPPGSFSLYGELLYKLAFDIEDFNWVTKRMAALEALSYDEFLAFSKALLGRQNKQRVAILLQGSQDNDERFEYTLFKTIKALKDLSTVNKKKSSSKHT